MASDMTPGRAAYEEFETAYPAEGWGPWDTLDKDDHAGWEAIAKAAIVAAPRWPKCPDGCGCRLGTEDADRRDCGCDGPCTGEFQETGYPEAPSYRDAAVRAVMDECGKLRNLLAEILDAVSAQGSGRRVITHDEFAAWRERARIADSIKTGTEEGQ